MFERECEIRGVKLMFSDAPSGMDVGSQFARSAIIFSNKLTRLATHGNARAGNIGRVLKGSVLSCKAAYGYRYCRDAELTSAGKVHIKKAWWEVNSADQDGKPVPGSPADTIARTFEWIGHEGRTVYWVAKKLNEIGIKGPSGGSWSQDSVRYVMLNHCYTGQHQYNATARVPNPKRPLGDITGAVRRTLIRPKPSSEVVTFSVPSLVTEELWLKANKATRERGRGRGKEGKVIASLLRNRIFCPQCGKPMVLRRRSAGNKFYYFCSRLNHALSVEHCIYRRFVPDTWDTIVWDCVYAILKDDSWIQERLSAMGKQNHDIDKLIKMEQKKILQSQNKTAKVREGFEGGLYSLNEAKSKVNDYQDVINKAEQEIKHVMGLKESQHSKVNVEELKKEMEALAQENLDKVTFGEKRDIISKLGIRVYPSEDLTTMKIRCSLNFTNDNNRRDSDGCAIIEFGTLRS